MRRVLSVVGMLFLVVILATGGFVAYATYQGRALDATSKAYVQTTVPAIVSTWSEQELLKRASPQLLTEIHKHPGQLGLMFRKLSALGAMQSFGHVQGESKVTYNFPHDKVATAAYEAKAVFANGTVDIKLRLILQAGKWKLLNFYVTAPASLKEQPEEQTV
ncbi:MAG: hypothetical protein ACK2T0_10875 [Anaerolineales bacterium]